MLEASEAVAPAPAGIAVDAELPHGVTIPVLGIRTRYETDSPEVARAVEEAFAAWRVLEDEPGWIEPEPALVRITLREGGEGPDGHAPVRWRTGGPVWVMETPGSRAVVDTAARRVTAEVTPALVADRAHFRLAVLESITLALLSRFDREPLHAAALVRGRTALLLAAPTGVGKSTLSYAAVRGGFKVLAEDAVFLQRSPSLRVWGMPGYLHLEPDAVAHFPELAGHSPTVRASGKVKLAVSVREMGGVAPLPVVERAGICILVRDGGAASLVPLTADEVEAALLGELDGGFVHFAETIGERIRLLAANGGWRLTISGPPAGMLQMVHRMFDEMEGRESPES